MPSPDPDAQPGTPPETFERAFAELEVVVHNLEDGELGLEAALASFEQGVRLLRHCYSMLERAEQRIELLAGVDADGRPVTQPFDVQAACPEEVASPKKGRRRASPRPGADSGRSEERIDVDEPNSLF